MDYEIAEVLGLKIKDGPYKGLYKSLDGVNPTLFTSPPRFSGNADLLEIAAVKLLGKLVPKEGLRADMAVLETCELVTEVRKRPGVQSIDILPHAFYSVYADNKGNNRYGPAIILIVED